MTTLMTDYQAPYATPRDDDLTTRMAELVTLLREAEARAPLGSAIQAGRQDPAAVWRHGRTVT